MLYCIAHALALVPIQWDSVIDLNPMFLYVRVCSDVMVEKGLLLLDHIEGETISSRGCGD